MTVKTARRRNRQLEPRPTAEGSELIERAAAVTGTDLTERSRRTGCGGTHDSVGSVSHVGASCATVGLIRGVVAGPGGAASSGSGPGRDLLLAGWPP